MGLCLEERRKSMESGVQTSKKLKPHGLQGEEPYNSSLNPDGGGTGKRVLELLRGHSPVGVGKEEMQVALHLPRNSRAQKLVPGRRSSKAGAGNAKRSWRMKQWLSLAAGGIKKLETEVLSLTSQMPPKGRSGKNPIGSKLATEKCSLQSPSLPSWFKTVTQSREMTGK